MNLAAQLDRLFTPSSMSSGHAITAITYAFQADYAADRVDTYMRGLIAMVTAGYNNQAEFYLFDQLDAQNSTTVHAISRLPLGNQTQVKHAGNAPYLLANEVDNYSFEREFGKLIAEQDTLAHIVADRTNRNINWFAQTAGRMVFLPF